MNRNIKKTMSIWAIATLSIYAHFASATTASIRIENFGEPMSKISGASGFPAVIRNGQPADISLKSLDGYSRFEATYRSASGKTCLFKIGLSFYAPSKVDLNLTGESIGPVPAYCEAMGYVKKWALPFDYAATLFMGG